MVAYLESHLNLIRQAYNNTFAFDPRSGAWTQKQGQMVYVIEQSR